MKRSMKIIGIIILGIIVLIGALYLYAKHRMNSRKDHGDLENTIEKEVAKFMDKGNADGIVIGIYKNGKTYLKGFGTIEKGQHIVPDSSMIFELASTSKLFTTSTLQILVDEGVLNLNDSIHSLLKEKVTMPASAQHTTLLHLATHLSGFPSLPNSFLTKMTDESNPYKSLVTNDIYDYLKTCEGKQKEGTFEYSNFGMGLLGHLLALKTDKSYEDLVKQKLLDELGMKNTFVTIDSMHRSKIVQGYDEAGNKALIWEDNVLTGAGSFLSNAADMMLFIKANLNEHETKISPSLIKTHAQQLNGETGLGWILPTGADKFVNNNDIIWHNGMAGGYASYIAIDKKNNFGVIILSNKAIDVTPLGLKLSFSTRTQSWKN